MTNHQRFGSAAADEVATLLLKLKAQGMTQLVVTHDMDFAEKIADKLLKVTALDQRSKQA